MRKVFASLCMAMVTIPAVAQEENEFSIDAQLRTRAEYNNGAITPRVEHEMPASFVNNRARLSMGWKRNNLELKASLQHVGVWGQDDIKERNGRVAMNEAWGKFTFWEDDTDTHYLKIGRQQLSYDDERILGGLDWNVAGNWHDAILYGWNTEGTSYKDQLNVVLSLNQTGENVRGGNYTGGAMPYKSLFLAWYHVDFETVPLSFSILALDLGRESAPAGANSDVKTLELVGTDINFRPSALDFHGAFYYEFGKNIADQKIAAWMATASLGYHINELWKVKLGYDYLSGADDDDTSGKQKTFDTLFGTHHKFLGSMDYWGTTPAQGLSDIQAGISTKALKKVDLDLNYHYFMLNNTKHDVNGDKFKSGLGHEIDLQLTAKLQKDVTLSGGYSFMLGSETMDAVKGGYHKSWQDWAWVSLNINPRIFSTKW